MKKYLVIWSFLMILVLLVTDADAQSRRRYHYRRRRPGGSSSITLNSVNFHAGFYKPSMKYWNEESSFAEAGKSFDGGMLYQGGLDFKVYDGVLIGIYGGYFSDDIDLHSKIGGIDRTETLSYKIMPFSLQAKYEVTMGSPRQRYRNEGIARLHPYFGVGLNYTLINQKFSRVFADDALTDDPDVHTSQKGSTVTYSGIVGLKYDITNTFGIGAEMNYYIGSFDQLISSSSTSDNQVENISLTGPSFSGKLYIKFPGKRRPSYRSPRRR